jgi:hypothetical protein
MALITSIGGSASDSFITVAQADVYIEDLPEDASAWEELSTEEKELRLQLAAMVLGHLPLRGLTVFRNQRLGFPRTCQPYNSRFEIPEPVKKTQAFLAYSVVHRHLQEHFAAGNAGVDSSWGTPSQISLAGLVSVSFAGMYGGGGAPGSMVESIVRALPFPANMLMKPYVSQIRGRCVPDPEDDRTLSTTTTTE